MTVGERIRALRIQNGLSLRKCAFMVDIDRRCLMRWERGVSNPSIRVLPRLAEVLNTTPEQITGVTLDSIAQSDFSPVPAGKRLRILRRGRGVSQYRLAEMTGLTQTLIAEFELGFRNLKPEELLKISDALGIDVRTLTGEENL